MNTIRTLTEKDFDFGPELTFNGIPLNEDENATWVFAYGHRDKNEFAEAVNEFDREMAGDTYDDEMRYVGPEVQHVWLVATDWNDYDEWFARKADAETPGAVPVTLVSR